MSVDTSDERLGLIGHPRAGAAIARLRSSGAIVAASLVVLVSARSGLPAFECGLRGLLAGVIGYFVGWGVGVAVWRELVRAEIHAAIRRARAASTPPGDTR